jgi:hypothetical protein
MRESFLRGLIDLHVHAGPSVANRYVDGVEMLYLAKRAGYRAFVIKDHYFPTMMSATIAEKHFNNTTGIRVFGGIALNNSVGVFNLNAVDAAYGMGAKFVWMPTVSSKHHIDEHKGHFPGSGSMSVPEKPVYYLDDKGQLLPDVVKILEYIAAHPSLILSTGHGSVREIDTLLHKAAELKVQKIIVNHPHFLIGATIEEIGRWAKLGANIELNAGVFETVGVNAHVPISVISDILGVVPIEQLIVDSDFGQMMNGDPVERHARFIDVLIDEIGLSEAQVAVMAKDNPAKLLEI